MMNKLVVGVLIVFSSISVANDSQKQPLLSAKDLLKLTQQSDAWIKNHAKNLNEQELQLIGNFLFLSHSFNALDIATRYQAQLLIHSMWLLRTATFENQDTTKLQEQCQSTLATFKELAQARLATCACWQACEEHTATIKNKLFQEALDAIKASGEQLMLTHARAHDAQINRDLISMQQILAQKGSILQQLGQFYKEMTNGVFPMQTTEDNKSIYKISIASELESKIDEHGWEAIQAGQLMRATTLNLQEISSTLFALYYSKLCGFIEKRNIPLVLMFGPSGLLPANQQTQTLPSLEESA